MTWTQENINLGKGKGKLYKFKDNNIIQNN